MGEIVKLNRPEDVERKEAREIMIAALESLLERARADSLSSVCFVAIPSDRETLSIGAIHTPDCGSHELVGATTMLSDYVRQIVQQ